MIKKAASNFLWVGGHRLLDYVNTEVMGKGGRIDLISDFADFVHWLAESEALTAEAAAVALREWGGASEREGAVARAREFRAALRGMVERISRGKSVPQTVLDEINRVVGKSRGERELLRVRGRFVERFWPEYREPIDLMIPIADSASDLLCHADLSLVKRCENAACVLYFYDQTKNHARRWCSMNICGNRMKVAAFYERQKRQRRRIESLQQAVKKPRVKR